MSIPAAIDAATAKILADAAKVRAAAKNLADVAAATGKAVEQTDAELVAFVHHLEEQGIHTTAVDSHGNLIDDSGLFELAGDSAHGLSVDANGKLIDQSGLFYQEVVDPADQPIETGSGYDESIGGEPPMTPGGG